MSLTRTSLLRILRLSSVFILIALIIGYAAWRSFNYARGPSILVYEPLNGSAIATDTVTINGKAERVISLALNGRAIFVDQQGNWSETMVVFPGQNSFLITASDRFGRNISKRLDVIGAFDKQTIEIE